MSMTALCSKTCSGRDFKMESSSSDSSTPNICIIGAGVSGLLAAIKVKKELGHTSFTVFDENEDIGGGWLCSYPGHYTDSLAHLCSYSFELKHDWSHNYVTQKEMLEYLRRIAFKYSLISAIKLNSEVKSLTWDPKVKKWNAIILNKKINVMKYCAFDIVICATGKLRVPVIPEEYQGFKGPIIHTNAWDPSIDLTNKVVGVIGSGNVAIQLIPAIEPKVKSLHYYQQNPSWILPKFQFSFSSWIQKILDYVPLILLFVRWILFFWNELFYFPVFIKNSFFNTIAHFWAESYIAYEYKKEDPTRRQLEPKYTFSTRPILHSSDFYKTMKKGKIKIHDEAITHVEQNTITTNVDEQQQLDILILAPENDTQEFFGPLKITDKYSQDLLSRWKNTKVPIRSYFGLTTSVTPNLFFLLGPNTTILHNSPMFLLESQMDLIVKLVKEKMKRNAKVIEVEEIAEDEFLTDLETQLKRTVWKSDKRGLWCSNSRGAVTSVWPWSSLRYWFRTRYVNFTKFRFY